ncbi:MAG: diacylglycerol kinase family lipid kinase [Lachnospiraceae bacterium]|nr:diacylglycerol kinase family lipid kinase [Lachnospiraceae bacterium]
MKKVLLVINIVSGKAQLSRKMVTIMEYYTLHGYEPTVHIIDPGKKLTLETFDKKDIEDYDLVVVGGGDGTLNHMIDHLMNLNLKPLIGYIPAGSTNDFARSIGIPADIIKACKVSLYGEPFTYDIGKLNDKYFNYVAAFGAFSEISYATNQDMKNALGYAAYMISAVTEFNQNIRYSRHMKIESDSFSIEDDFVFGAVSNSVSVGGIKLFEGRDVGLDDGKLELLLIKAPQSVADLQIIMNFLGKGDLDNSYVSLHQIERLKITSDEDIAWAIDGEYGGSSKYTQISIIDKAVTIMSGSSMNDKS